MDLVVVEREQREILQVLEGVGADAVDLIGIQQPEGVDKHMEGGRKEGRVDQLVRVSLCTHSLYIPAGRRCTGTKFIPRLRLLW